jgi:hypothetical protein
MTARGRRYRLWTSMVRRGSTVRVRQRACESGCKVALSCCLNIEHADTFRTHLRYPRRIATSPDVFRHGRRGDGWSLRTTTSLQEAYVRCLNRRERDPFSTERRSSPGGSGRDRVPRLRRQSASLPQRGPTLRCRTGVMEDQSPEQINQRMCCRQRNRTRDSPSRWRFRPLSRLTRPLPRRALRLSLDLVALRARRRTNLRDPEE